jgi:E3 ubiquitin-protein ligase NEDD4
VAVQIFDQRKFKRKDQGFLGVVNVRVSDVLDLELGGHGTLHYAAIDRNLIKTRPYRDADFRPQKIQ